MSNNTHIFYGGIFAEMAKPMLTAALHERFEQASRALISKVKRLQVREIEKYTLDADTSLKTKNLVGVLADIQTNKAGAFHTGKFRLLTRKEAFDPKAHMNLEETAIFNFRAQENSINEILRQEWYKEFAFRKYSKQLQKYLTEELRNTDMDLDSFTEEKILNSIGDEQLSTEFHRLSNFLLGQNPITMNSTRSSVESYVVECSYTYILMQMHGALQARPSKTM